MINAELVLLDPLCRIVDTHAAVTQVCRLVYEQTVAGRGAESVDYNKLAFGILLAQVFCGEAHGVDRS